MVRKAFSITWFALFCFCQPLLGQMEFFGDPMIDVNFVSDEFIGDEFVGDEYIEAPVFDQTVKFTFDGMLFSRVGGDTEQPLILQDEFPAPPSLTSGDLNFEAQLGGRAELIFFAKPGGFAPRASVIWTGTESSTAERTGNPADIFFFNATDAEPSPGYTARNKSRFTYGDIGVRRTVSPTYGWSAGLAFGQLIESLDLISDPDETAAPLPGGGVPVETETGFFSQTHNQFYGLQLGLDAQLWTNGLSKIEGGLTGGIFYNDISVGAQAENANQDWDTDETAYVCTATLSLVIPADPVNFRFGYQGAFLTGMALPASQSRELSIVRGTGDNVTDDVWYHGFLFGIELIR